MECVSAVVTMLSGGGLRLVLVVVGVAALYFAWKHRSAVKDAVFDIINKMPKGGSQQDRIPKPVLQRVAESTHKSGDQEGPHTE